ncbi:BAG6.2 family protein [Megaselia abdita]
METDDDQRTSNSFYQNIYADDKSQEESGPSWNDSSLPPVSVGSEQWHSLFSQNWVPVLVRDASVQRSMPVREPFSDTYIAGMSAKRRKLIESSKPDLKLDTLLSQTVCQTLGSSGFNTPAPIGEISDCLVNDSSVQTSLRETIITSVSDRLCSDPNYNESKYPNIEKYFKK